MQKLICENDRRNVRILVNATTLVVGGGIQIGKSVVEYMIVHGCCDMDFLFAVSRGVYEELSPEQKNDPRVRVFCESPAGLRRGIKTRVELRRLESEYQPNLVYSLGFPSYVKFKAPEIGRYTNPWEINPPPLPWDILNFFEKLITFLGIKYRLAWAKKASYFETQTASAKMGIVSRLSVSDKNVFVIPNSYNSIFQSENDFAKERKVGEPISVFCLAAAYKHKNLTIVPDVAKILRNLEIDAIFYLSLPFDSEIAKEIALKAESLGVTEKIINLGPLKLADCYSWYKKLDIVFLPTLLEVFSATYLEAMAMRKPIITSDLPFARDVCADAALYFDCRSPEMAAEKIKEIATDQKLFASLIDRGTERLSFFPSSERKYQMIFDTLLKVAEAH